MSDWRAIDPNQKALVAAMRRALTAANKDQAPRQGVGRKLVFSDAAMRQVAQTCLGKPEGRHRVAVNAARGYREVVIGWWADPLGRKHVRVTGRWMWSFVVQTDPPRTPAGMPAVWSVYPESFLRYQTPDMKRAAGVVVCRCGAVGSPRSLAWVGDCCGPCYDRRQEGGTPTAGFGPVPGLTKWSPGVAFTPDGASLLTDDGGRPCLTELATGSRRHAAGHNLFGTVAGAVFTSIPDKGPAAVIAAYGGVVCWPLNEDTLYEVARGTPGVLRPDGLASCPEVSDKVKVVDLSSAPPKGRSFTTGTHHIGGRYAADGRLLTLDREGTVWALRPGSLRLEPVRRGVLAGWESPGSVTPNGVTFAPDGSMVAVIGRPDGRGPYFVRTAPIPKGPVRDIPMPSWYRISVSHWQCATSVEFSPDNSTLATIGEDGWVGLWDLPGGKNPVWVQVGPSQNRASIATLVFSPTGSALAVALRESTDVGSTVFVIPWRALRTAPVAE